MPLVSQTFDQLLDFTRTTSGTFVGSNGLVQTTPASVNLLTFTQEFDNAAWAKFNATISANSTVAPDGTTTADKLMVNTTNGQHNAGRSSLTPSGTTATISVFAKAAELSWLALTDNQAFGAYFDLTNGVTGSSIGAIISKSITSFGNGWYRCSVTFTSDASNSGIAVVATNANNVLSFAGANTTDGIFIRGAQLEAASAATTYTRNNGGVFPPRFDYDPVTLAAKGLLIEEQRTNLVVRSAEFDNASWAKTASTVTANATTSPDGTVDADTLVENTANDTHFLSVIPSTSAGSHTLSVFYKIPSARKLALYHSGTNTGRQFDASGNQSAGLFVAPAGGATVTSFGNGWYRATITVTTTAAQQEFRLWMVRASDDAISYAGDGTSGIALYGAQLEAGAFATSYIPTVASQVTRTGDQCAIVAPNFAPWYNQSEGTFVVNTSPIAVDNDISFSVSNSGGYNNSIYLPADSGSQFVVVNGGSVQANIDAGTFTANTTNRVAAAYKAADFAASVNGGAVVTTASGTIPTVDRAVIGGLEANTANRFNGHISSIRYYPTRLSNAQLQALTA